MTTPSQREIELDGIRHEIKQLSFLAKPTTAQIVYGLCYRHYMSQRAEDANWNRAIVATVEETGIDEALVRRIVRVQSKWDARRLLRKATGKS